MKKLILSSILIFLSIFTVGLKPAYAETLKGPVFKADESITFNETVDGDVFLLGGEVTVNATISGDLIVLAGQADIRGTIDGDLRVTAGQLDVGAIVNDDASLASGQIKLNSNSIINNTLTAAAGAISLNGQVVNQAWLIGGKINILEGAKVGGDLKVFHQSEPIIHPQSKISGDLITKQLESNDFDYQNDFNFKDTKVVKKITTFMVVQKLMALVIEILIGALLIYLAPKLSKTLVKLSQKKPGQTIGWGFLTVVIFPVVFILLLISLIGIPLAVLSVFVFSFSIYLARLLSGLSLGNNLLKDKKLKPYHSLALGMLILSVLKLIPVVGWLVYFIFILNGLGTLALHAKTAFDNRQK